MVGLTVASLAAPFPARTTVKNLADGWGSIRGQVVFTGEIPKPAKLNVDKDLEHCLSKGDLLSQKWVVNGENRGVRWVMAVLKPSGKEPLEVHPDVLATAPKEVVLDQPICTFEPRVFGIHTGQTLLAKNSSPVAHNVVILGINNSINDQLPPNTQKKYLVGTDLKTDYRPVRLSCGAHSWMEGYTWILDHPYHTTTDANGKFELKNVPAGNHVLLLWHETGYVGSDRSGRPIEVTAGGVTDLGKVEVSVRD
jgi:hypothetical protein